MTGEGLTGVTQGNEPVPDAGTINGVGQWGGSTSYSNYSLEGNKTYRLRLANTGSFAASRFSVDGHVLTVIEADGTPVTPYEVSFSAFRPFSSDGRSAPPCPQKVSGLVIDVAQRYSVLLKTNQTAGAYWMRGTVQSDSFTVSWSSCARGFKTELILALSYSPSCQPRTLRTLSSCSTTFQYAEPGFNGNQLAVIRYGVDESAMPDASVADSDPGAGNGAPGDLDVSLLVPQDAMEAPNSTV